MKIVQLHHVHMIRSSVGLALLLSLLLLIAGCGTQNVAGERRLGSIDNYEATHRLSPADSSLNSDVTLLYHPSDADSFFFILHKDLQIRSFVSDGFTEQPVQLAVGEAIPDRMEPYLPEKEWMGDSPHLALYGLPLDTEDESIEISMSYSGVVYDAISVPEFSRMEIADETTGIIDTAGAFLIPATGYYPVLPGENQLARFKTTIEYPETWQGLVEGNLMEEQPGRARFDSMYPLDGSYLVAGPYEMDTFEADSGATVAMYHYGEHEDLHDAYLHASARYLDRFSKEIGPYPWERFSVVENWFPTGYGMPTYTLLGSEVIRLPFIIHISLMHEVAHNWWGNGVYVDYESGNWCEGLTTYYSDYARTEDQAPEAAMQYRMDILRDYSEYVVRGDDEDFALREFTSRTTPGSRSIGYGKSMMVYHMARLRIGDENFSTAMQNVYSKYQFRAASWSDFFNEFEELSGELFGWYEEQWIDRGGAPQFEVANAIVQEAVNGENWLLEFDLTQIQDGDTYQLDIPVELFFASDSSTVRVLHDVNGKMYHARIGTEQRPIRFQVDPGFDVFRVLSPLETPPTLAGFFAAEEPLVVLPSAGSPMAEAYEEFARSMLSRTEAQYVNADTLAELDTSGRTILWLGRNSEAQSVLEREALSGVKGEHSEHALVWAARNPDNPNEVNVDVWATGAGQLQQLARKLPHYGKYSYLAFATGTNVAKGQWKVENSPLMVNLPEK